MKSIKNFIIEGKHQKPIVTDVFYKEDHQPKKVVIFCHGYKGFKDWGCWDLVAEEFVNRGFNFIKFNFSHNGVTTENPTEFDDLEAFGNNNYTKELFDLQVMMDWVSADNEFDSFFDKSEIYVIGHSRGGGIVTLTSAKDSRVKKAVTWASVSNLIDRLPSEIEDWKSAGVVYQLNGRTKQNMPLYYQFKENTILNKEFLDIEKISRKIKIPFCVIHGRKDIAVKEEEATNLDKWIPTSQLILIEDATHTFGSYHPYDKDELPEDLKTVVDESINFLEQ